MQRHKGFEEVVVRWDPGPAERAAEEPPEPSGTHDEASQRPA
jgi:hypothetical protein